MLYLLDANVLITAHNTYYPIDRVPEFWAWLNYQGQCGRIKIPREMVEEALGGTKQDDLLLQWLKAKTNRGVLELDESADATLVQLSLSDTRMI